MKLRETLIRAKDQQREIDQNNAMDPDDPLYQAASTVLYLHEEDREFNIRFTARALEELAQDKIDRFFKEIETDLDENKGVTEAIKMSSKYFVVEIWSMALLNTLKRITTEYLPQAYQIDAFTGICKASKKYLEEAKDELQD